MAEYSAHVDNIHIEVDKVGGGTLGRNYVGDWWVSIQRDGRLIMHDILHTGTAKTHGQVAALAVSFLDDVDGV